MKVNQTTRNKTKTRIRKFHVKFLLKPFLNPQLYELRDLRHLQEFLFFSSILDFHRKPSRDLEEDSNSFSIKK